MTRLARVAQRPLLAVAAGALALSALSIAAANRADAQAAHPGAPAASASAPTAMPPGDPLGPDLFMAISRHDAAAVRALLAKGAKVEATNWLGITPLIWAAAVGELDSCRALIAAGANVNAPTHYGAALTFAEMSGNAKVVAFLLDHGAKLTKDRVDGITPLMTAADAGHVQVIRLLLDKFRGAAGVNAQDTDGTTALMCAARRDQTEAARLLLAAGARIDVKDSHGRTALMYAARSGYAETVRLLLAHKAQVNGRDAAGNTALHLAARYCADRAAEQATAQALLRAGADAGARDSKGRTAREIAAAREQRAAVAASPAGLSLAGLKSAAPLAERARQAAGRSLTLIEKATRTFSTQAGCVSCHHQGLGLMVTGVARDRGFAYDRTLEQEQLKLIADDGAAHAAEMQAVLPHPELYKYVPAVDMGEYTPGAAFFFSGMLAHGVPANPGLGGATTILARQQWPDGSWGFNMHREPIQSSAFTTTALTVRLLKAYMPRELAAETEQRIAKARAWLVRTPAVTNEDRTFRLLGLKWAGAEASEVAKAAAELRKAQRPDGGWAQLPAEHGSDAYTRSDAYATGEALYALQVAGGLSGQSDCERRGVQYLLRTQDDDGSWLVVKRAIPANTYFDAGFPHGESQFISYGATCWATMALMEASRPAPAQEAGLTR